MLIISVPISILEGLLRKTNINGMSRTADFRAQTTMTLLAFCLATRCHRSDGTDTHKHTHPLSVPS